MAEDQVKKFFIGFAIAVGVGLVPLGVVIASRPAAPVPQQVAQVPAKPAAPAPSPASTPKPATPEISKPKAPEPEPAPVAPKPLELAPAPIAPPPIAPEPAPMPEPEALTAVPGMYKLPAGISLGTEIKVGGLRVQALRRAGASAKTEILTLREAMASGKCRVTEHPNDGYVRIHNESDSPVMCMPGELLLGGRKDRVICACEIIEPGIVDYRLPVMPVEGKRTTEDSTAKPGEFKIEETMAMVDLRTRNAATGGAGAATLLKRVATTNKRFAAKEDASIRAGIKAADVAAQIKLMAAQNDANTVGFIVQDQSGIIAIDLFHSRALFEKYAAQLMRSYALAAGEEPTAKQVKQTTPVEGHWDGEKEFIGFAGR